MPLEAVGKNLGEHASFSLTEWSANDSSLFLKIKSAEMEKMLEQYHRDGEGIFSVPTDGSQCFIRSSKAEEDWPNLLIGLNPLVSIDDEEHRFHFINVLGRPKSKGTVTLDADKYRAGITDDVELALIDYKLLTHPDDIEALLDGKTLKQESRDL